MDKKNIQDNPDFEPEWLKKAAKSMLKGQKESSGNEEQDEIMNMIDSNDDDQL